MWAQEEGKETLERAKADAAAALVAAKLRAEQLEVRTRVRRDYCARGR